MVVSLSQILLLTSSKKERERGKEIKHSSCKKKLLLLWNYLEITPSHARKKSIFLSFFCGVKFAKKNQLRTIKWKLYGFFFKTDAFAIFFTLFFNLGWECAGSEVLTEEELPSKNWHRVTQPQPPKKLPPFSFFLTCGQQKGGKQERLLKNTF